MRSPLNENQLLKQMGFLSPNTTVPNTLSSNSDLRGQSVEDSLGSNDENVFILMPFLDPKKGIPVEKIEDQYLKKRQILPIPFNDTSPVQRNREIFKNKKQLGRKYFKKFIQKIEE
jgi:hypothetical protein